MDNEGQSTTERVKIQESKEELEMNGNDEMEWNGSIGMVMDKSECDRSS